MAALSEGEGEQQKLAHLACCSLTLYMEAGYRNRRKLGILSRETCGKYQSSSALVWFLDTFPSTIEGDVARLYLREPLLESVP